MSAENVLTNLEQMIKKVCLDIKKRKGSVGGDKLDSLSKLVNSYTRLSEHVKVKQHDATKDGDPNWYPEN